MELEPRDQFLADKGFPGIKPNDPLVGIPS